MGGVGRSWQGIAARLDILELDRKKVLINDCARSEFPFPAATIVVMKIPRIWRYTFTASLVILAGGYAFGAVAYDNIPPSPPFYNPNSGSTIFEVVTNSGVSSGSIAMSFVPTVTGTISSIELGLTVFPGFDGNVNVYLGQNPTPLPNDPNRVNLAQVPLGNATTTAPVGTDTTLTQVVPPNPVTVFSGQTYYMVLTPGIPMGQPNIKVLWNENITGAISTYYQSNDNGATFTLGGVFNSDALEVDVLQAIPEPSTWVGAALMTGAMVSVGARRFRRSVSRVRR